MREAKRVFNEKTGFLILFLLPSVILYLLIYAAPLATVFATSFAKWDYRNFNKPEFLGFSHLFDNYVQLLARDYYFWDALLNSLKWAGLSLAVKAPLAAGVAAVLSSKPFGWRFARNVFIVPNIISPAAIGLMFFNIYNPGSGLLERIARIIRPGLSVNVLADEKLAFWGVSLSFLLFAGSSMVLALAQLASINPELSEAARMDGAGGVQVFARVSLPLMRPVLGAISILEATYGLLLYSEIALITKGGPDKATYSLSWLIYQKALGSSKLNFALANTAGVAQILVGVLVVGLVSKAFRANYSDL
jgi:raffinose/stachyose/melibiose transport system permease protein